MRESALRANVRLAARAKINLRLHVLAREASGYHQIETLFCALDHADDIEITLGGQALQLDVESADGIEVPADEQNLVYRAAALFFEAAGRLPAAAVRLKKRIPVGAGLGGGSSDAAATLKGLNLLCKKPFNSSQLLELGAKLGADVPFFLCGSSLALAWGRGERLLPLEPLPPMPTLLVVPPFPIETRGAYGALRLDSIASPDLASLQRLQSWDAVQEDAVNAFEAALFPLYPRLENLRDALRDAGATTAMLTGSGSTVFGLFPARAAVARAARRLREQFPEIRTIETKTVAWPAD
jgi:4-diphosphocytidyl-2-C-methyl-D-erythritol kinase